VHLLRHARWEGLGQDLGEPEGGSRTSKAYGGGRPRQGCKGQHLLHEAAAASCCSQAGAREAAR